MFQGLRGATRAGHQCPILFPLALIALACAPRHPLVPQ